MKALVTAIGLLTALPAYADIVWAVRPEPGLVCMTPANGSAPFTEYPRKDAKVIANLIGIVFAVSSTRTVNGYIEVEGGNREEGWVPKEALKLYTEKCVPKLMSNGRLAVGD